MDTIFKFEGTYFVVDRLTYWDIQRMTSLLNDISRRGIVDYTNKIWLAWKETVGDVLKDSNELLVFSTIFPVRLGIAISLWFTYYFENCHKGCKSNVISW